MTTGTAGLLDTDSNTVRIVLGPPSRTNSTTGTPCDLPEKARQRWLAVLSNAFWRVEGARSNQNLFPSPAHRAFMHSVKCQLPLLGL